MHNTSRSWTQYLAAVCCYCSQILEMDRTSVEHLDGMNRVRLGLHIPGNVILACKRCNGEKRRDDQLGELTLASSGWESFLWHDAMRCGLACNTCRYWQAVWPSVAERVENMKRAREKIAAFRSQYPASLRWSRNSQTLLRQTADLLYRGCQEFATTQIQQTVDEAFRRLSEDASTGCLVPDGNVGRDHPSE